MLEAWERGQISRLEKQVFQLERESWERADFIFRVKIHGLTVAIVLLAVLSVALSASHPGH
jgi:hypothetical protein